MKAFGGNSKGHLKTHWIPLFATVTFVLAAATVGGLKPAWSKTGAVHLSGQIQDSACAGTAARVEKQCAEMCVRNGAKWVLYHPSTGEIYQLDDQLRASRFVAQTVVVAGTLNRSSKTIHVIAIRGA